MKIYYRYLLFFILCATILFSLAILGVKQATPYIESEIHTAIQDLKKETRISIQWNKLSVYPLFKVTMHMVSISHPHMKAPLSIQKLETSVNWIHSLFKGRLLLNINIQNSNYLIGKSDSSSTTEYSLTELLSQIPIKNISFANLNIQIQTHKDLISVQKLNGRVRNLYSSIDGFIDSTVKIKDHLFYSEGSFALNQNQLEINELKIKNKDTAINLVGSISNVFKKIEMIKLRFNKSSFFVEHMHDVLQLLDSSILSGIQGQVEAQFDLAYLTKTKVWNGNFDGHIRQVNYKNWSASEIRTQGYIKNNKMEFKLLHVTNEAQWTLYFEKAKLSLNSNLPFSSKVYLNIYQVESIQKGLNFQLPLSLNGFIPVSCQGQLNSFSLKCNTDKDKAILVERLSLFPESEKNKVLFSNLRLNTQFSWNKRSLSISGEIFSGLQSSVQFHLKTDPFLNTHIKVDGEWNLSTSIDQWFSMKPKGRVQINQAKIDYKEKTGWLINADFKISRLFLDEIEIGSFNSNLYVQNQIINLKNIKGYLRESQYQGDLSIDLTDDTSVQTNLQFPIVYLSDLKLDSHISPFLKTEGKGNIKLQLNITEINTKPIWNFQFRSAFQDMKLYDESFKSLVLNIDAVRNQISIRKAVAQKIKGAIYSKGTIYPTKEVDISISGRGLLLERSELFSQWFNPHFKSILRFNSRWKGLPSKLQSQFSFNLTNTFFGSKYLKNSNGKLQISNDQIKGQVQFFKNQLQIHSFQFLPKQNQLSLNLQAQKLNYIPFMKHILPRDDLSSQWTGKAHIQVPVNKWSQISGKIQTQSINLKKGALFVQSNTPHTIQLNNGTFHLKENKIHIIQNKNRLILKKEAESKYNIAGAFNLHLFSFLTPSLESLQGRLNLDLTFHNQWNALNPFGPIRVTKGSFKLHQYIDTLESIELRSRINKNKYVISTLTAKTLNGELKTSGSIHLSSSPSINIKTWFKDIDFNILKNTGSRLTGNIFIKGQSFPYTLSGNVFMKRGQLKVAFENLFKENQKINNVDPLVKKEETPISLNLKLQTAIGHPIEVDNSTMSALLDGELFITGSVENPILDGGLHFRSGGRIRIQDYDFDIQVGRIFYKKTKPQFAQIDFKGNTIFKEIKQVDNQLRSQDYEIQLAATGSLNQPTLSFSSIPELSESEILTMMLLGVRSIDPVATQSYSRIGVALFQNLIGSTITDWLGVDVAMAPHFLKEGISTQIQLRKQWTDRLSTSMSAILPENINQKLEGRYSLTPNLSLLGIWVDEQDLNKKDKEQSNILGLDIEYELHF